MIQAGSSPSEAYEKVYAEPGDRDRGGELGVAERGEGADDAGHDEGQGDGGARGVLGDRAGEDEDAGADDDTDAEDRQVQGGQGLLERVLRLLGVLDGLLDASSSGRACCSRAYLPRLSSST